MGNNKQSAFSQIVTTMGGKVSFVRGTKAFAEAVASLPCPKHKGWCWVVEIFYDDVLVAAREQWREWGFVPPKYFVIDGKDTKEQAIEQAVAILALDVRAVAFANICYTKISLPVSIAMKRGAASWNGLMGKAVGESEWQDRVDRRTKRIQSATKTIKDTI